MVRGIDINGPYRGAPLVIDPKTGTGGLVSRRMSTSSQISWAPDSRWIAFVGWPDGTPGPIRNSQDVPPTRHTEIFTVNLDGTGERQVTHEAAFADSPRWAPNGSAIAYTLRPSADPTDRIAVVPFDEDG